MVRYRLVAGRRIVWVAVPPLAVTVALGLFVIAELAGAHPLTNGIPRNVSEAIAVHDHATAARLLSSPRDADEVAMIRTGMLGDRVMFATPAETAVLVHDGEALDLMMARGWSPDASRSHLLCLARDVHDDALEHVLRGPSSPTCGADDGLRRVLRRP